MDLFGDTGAINFSYYSQFPVNSGKGEGGKGGWEPRRIEGGKGTGGGRGKGGKRERNAKR